MSLDASAWARAQVVGKSTAKHVLRELADRAGADDTCWPSVETISQDTEQNRKTVIDNLKYLQAKGFIADTGGRKGRTGKVIVYRLVDVRHGAIDYKQSLKRNGSKNGTVAAKDHPKTKQSQKRNDSENGTVPKTDGNSPENGTLNSPENGTQNLSVEPIIEPFTAVEAQAVDLEPTSNDGNENIHSALCLDTTQAADQLLATSPSREQFNMHWDWQPSTFLAERCKVMGINLNLFDVDSQEQILGEFRSFWSSKPTKQNQGGWEHKFAQRLKQLQVARESATADPPQSKQAVRAGVTAQIMNISDTTW